MNNTSANTTPDNTTDADHAAVEEWLKHNKPKKGPLVYAWAFRPFVCANTFNGILRQDGLSVTGGKAIGK